MSLINNTYEHKLAYIYHQIDKVGLLINQDKLQILRKDVLKQIKQDCEELSSLWNCHVYVGRENFEGKTGSLNLNASSGNNTVLKKLQSLGFVVPKVRKKDAETGDIEYKDSAEELALRRCLAEEKDQNHIKALKLVLDVRELNTLKNRYINARLYNNIYYSNYNVAGTVTGRRSCRKNSFGLGGNAQNFPKHYTIGKRFLECITTRPGKIFLIVDQMQAEDWPVSALAENHEALKQLREGFDRHTDLASFIFGIPKSSRTMKEWKDSIERFLGKKCRHAHNYGMRGQMMSDSLAKEGYYLSKDVCNNMLDKVSQYDPTVESVFHSYIKNELFSKRMLCTPMGRERIFFGLRQNDTNYKILNEAYAYIPQSVVGDNTGLAVTYQFDNGFIPIQESHDSIANEIEDNFETIRKCFDVVGASFNRTITFSNGVVIQIPIEAELGYNFNTTIKLKDYTEKSLEEAYEKIQKTKAPIQETNPVTTTV